jgi:hypothetical protein
LFEFMKEFAAGRVELEYLVEVQRIAPVFERLAHDLGRFAEQFDVNHLGMSFLSGG